MPVHTDLPPTASAGALAHAAVLRGLEEVQAYRLEAAMQHFSQAITHDPQHVDAWVHLGRGFLRLENWANAAMCMETALAPQPGHAWAQHGLAFARYNSGQREEALALIDEVCARTPDSAMWQLRAYMHSQTNPDPRRTLEVYRDWGRRFADPLTLKARPLPPRSRDPQRRLKVGYVSADLRRHSIAFFIAPVFEHHDPQQVEVHVYSVGPRDEFTDRMQAHVPHWHDVAPLSEDALCRLIRSHGIDILIDLSGHTEGNRLLTFAERAAPIQLTWLGFMHPLGMKAMDYRFVDGALAPPGHDAFYSERLFHLNCMTTYAPPDSPLCESLPMQRKGHPTLISLNSSTKLTNEMLAVWARILALRPDAQLIIMVKERTPELAQAHMLPRVQAAGMPLDRVFVMHQQPLDHFMELGHIADIALDTSPVCGGTTTLHALWMGLSIVTLDAERGVDAATALTLRGLGFGGEVAEDVDGYVQAALRLMDDPERLLAQRLGARERMRRSFLMDYGQHTRDLEKAFRLMWLNWLRGDHRSLTTATELEPWLQATRTAA